MSGVMTPTPGLLFSGIMLPLLALCYYCGVLPVLHSREYLVRRSNNPQQFKIGAAIYLASLILVAVVWK